MSNLLLAARSMGATLPQLIARVIIPASIPTVLAGPAARRRPDHHRRRRVRDAHLGQRHRLSGRRINRTILDSPRVFGGDHRRPRAVGRCSTSSCRAIERRTLVWQTAGRASRIRRDS